MAAEFALIAVIRPHNGPGFSLLDGSPESRQIDLPQRTVINHHIHLLAVRLLIVKRKMLNTCCNAVRLHTPNIRYHHPRRQERVLAHVFEVPAVERHAVDIHSGAQQHILLPIASLLTHRFPVKGRHLGIPGRRQTRQGRESRTGIVRPPGLFPLVPQHFGSDTMRAVGAPHLGNAEARNPGRREFRLGMEQRHLLFESHTREGILDTNVQRLIFIQIGRHIGFGRGPAATTRHRGKSH